ncbi:o-succinylbenzoate synthase [Proteiniphilum sp. UBA1028]|jgi:o-succinylbenzoate synthase|uniref:o-succinylbenzoate synthase n=1 Tax=Proteiniphilum sp. UBA1028 TaxID=1947251 RepID=UPI0025DC0AE0|nr:o-succinylbenzoate synthase [Proteiniphilum sp. UBA1028]
MFRIEIIPYTLRFKQPAGTSRGVYHEHRIWYVLLRDVEDPSHVGIGECAPLPDLSCDYSDRYAETLSDYCRLTEQEQQINTELLREHSSILFGLETAMLHYRQRSWQLWDTPFSRGETGITINGLIWMGEFREMMQQIEAKLEKGFGCIKLKIGAIDFEKELALLRFIRSHYSAREVELRVDANGAFAPEEALEKLHRLAELKIHSIEQPIRAGQWDEMSRLCGSSPLSIALDEELIGIHNFTEKRALLDAIRPQYIILKPSLHGGISGCNEWVALANELEIGWWVTSALESNIGLNSIAQWCATLDTPVPQGLGTGSLYYNNLPLPLEIRGDCLWFNPSGTFPDKPLQEYEPYHD